jgi:hypothetical protein
MENHNALISFHSAKDLHVFKTLSEKGSEKKHQLGLAPNRAGTALSHGFGINTEVLGSRRC